MILNASGSGGGVTYSVIAAASYAALPASRPNTIAIITTTGIGKTSIRPSAPGNPANGDVWITPGGSGARTVSILSGRDVILYPVAAYQYINGLWSPKNAYVGNGADWASAESVLYNYGATPMGIAITGISLPDASDQDGPLVNFDTNQIRIRGGWAEGQRSYVQAYIDLTGYSAVQAQFARTADPAPFTMQVAASAVSGGRQGEGIVAAVTAATGPSSGTLTLNVSALSGWLYVKVGAVTGNVQASQNLYIYTIKLF